MIFQKVLECYLSFCALSERFFSSSFHCYRFPWSNRRHNGSLCEHSWPSVPSWTARCGIRLRRGRYQLPAHSCYGKGKKRCWEKLKLMISLLRLCSCHLLTQLTSSGGDCLTSQYQWRGWMKLGGSWEKSIRYALLLYLLEVQDIYLGNKSSCHEERRRFWCWVQIPCGWGCVLHPLLCSSHSRVSVL